jgi:hypothetical protein
MRMGPWHFGRPLDGCKKQGRQGVQAHACIIQDTGTVLLRSGVTAHSACVMSHPLHMHSDLSVIDQSQQMSRGWLLQMS